MSPKEELKQFVATHGDDPRVWAALLDMASRAAAGERMDSIAASYGVNWEEVVACRQKKN